MDQINGQNIIEKKACNAKIVNATPNFTSYLVSFISGSLSGAPGAIGGAIAFGGVIGIFKKMMGGLWVGGNAYLTSHNLIFKPNKLNTALHSNIDIVEIPLGDIVKLQKEFGVLTGIIDIETKHGALKIRCFNASGFMERINQMI